MNVGSERKGRGVNEMERNGRKARNGREQRKRTEGRSESREIEKFIRKNHVEICKLMLTENVTLSNLMESRE